MSVRNGFCNRSPVRNDDAVKAHAPPELAPELRRIKGAGNSVGRTKGRHYGGCASLNTRLKRR